MNLGGVLALTSIWDIDVWLRQLTADCCEDCIASVTVADDVHFFPFMYFLLSHFVRVCCKTGPNKLVDSCPVFLFVCLHQQVSGRILSWTGGYISPFADYTENDNPDLLYTQTTPL